VADLLGDVIETDHWCLKEGNCWPLLFHVGRRGKPNRVQSGWQEPGRPRRREFSVPHAGRTDHPDRGWIRDELNQPDTAADQWAIP
jgi:hypothetical protein